MRARTSWGGFVGLLVSGLVVFACGQIAGLEDPDPGATDGGGPSASGLAAVEIGPTELDFADVPCATESVAKLVTLVNKGTAPADYRVQLPDGTPFRIDGPLEGTLAPGAPATTLRVIAKPNAADQLEAEILITAGTEVRTVRAKTRGLGATFEPSTTIATFGEVRMQTGAETPVSITVKNAGTDALVIPSFSGQKEGFDVTWDGKPTPLRIEPGQEKVVSATFASGPETPTEVSAQLVPDVASKVCGPMQPITLKGRRVSFDVTIGAVDFGQVNCSPPTTPRNIVISNFTNTAINWTATLSPTSTFEIKSGATGGVPGGSGAAPTLGNIVVAPKSTTGFGTFNETVDVVINPLAPPSGGPRKTTLSLAVRGANLTITPNPVTGYTSNGSTTDTKTVTIKNDGADRASISWFYARPAGDPAWTWSSLPGSIAAGGTATVSMDFRPSGTCPCVLTLSGYRSSGTPSFCSGSPFVITFQGTRTQ